MLLLCALVVGSRSVWADDPVTIASFTASTYYGGTTGGWSVSNSEYATSNGGHYKLISNDASIETPSINWSNYTSITITISARTFGGPNDTQKKISVSQGSTELTSYSPSGTSIVASSALSISPSGTGKLTIACLSASSSKGSSVQTIEIKGTSAASSSEASVPVFSLAGGAHIYGSTFTISSSNYKEIRYTTNGEDPEIDTGDVYSSPIAITGTMTVKAIAVDDNDVPTAVVTRNYSVKTPDAPSFSKAAGAVTEGTDITITVEEGCVVKYTTDDSNPASSGTATTTLTNTTTVTIDNSKKIRALAVDGAGNTSSEASASYVMIDANAMQESRTSFSFDQAAEVSGKVESDITWTAYVGGASTNPGNYNSGIRLYQINGTNAYGGYVTLTAPSGFKIQGFTITSTSTYATTVNYTVGAYTSGFDGTNYSLAKSSDYSIYGLDCQSVSIYNLGTGSSGRLEIGAITVVYVGEGSISLNAACTDGEKYFGTYSNSHAFVVPAGLTVSEINVVDKKMKLGNYAEGDVVPANTGVLVSAATSGSKAITFTGKTGSAIGTNLLRPSGDAGVEASAMSDTDYYYYRLTMVDSKPGFWWKSAEGAGFALGANKAYLKVLKTAAEAQGFWFDDETTGIANVNSKQQFSGEYYNLNGQKVAQPTKGLYIVNGKKVIIK